MPDRDVAAFYRENPRMVSSPFGGIDGIDADLFRGVLRELVISFENKRVLDIGCGRGFAGAVINADGGRYTGADFVTSRTGFPLVCSDAAHLPFADGAFDAAMCLDAFEHFPDQPRAAAEIRRILKPGGVFFLSAPNYANIAGVVKKIYEGLGWYESETWAPFGRWQPQELETFLTPRRIRDIFRSAGFDRIWYRGYPGEVGLGVFPWIDHPRMPDSIRFRIQRVFGALGPALVRVWPGSSLHGFWRIEC